MSNDVNLLESLLDAIVRLDGDALVMHVGEKPYVVTTSEALNEFRGPLAWGQVELSSRILTFDAVTRMLGHILPEHQRRALEEYGATEFDVTSTSAHAEKFTVVAARGGEDIWIEIRRKAKQPHAAPAPGIEQAQRAAPEHPADAPEDVHEPADAHVAAAVPVEAAPAAAGHVEEFGAVDEPDDAVDEPDESEDAAAWLVAEPEEFPPFSADAHEDEIVIPDADALLAVQDAIVAEPEWGDDVMTEVDLAELLRVSAGGADASRFAVASPAGMDRVPAFSGPALLTVQGEHPDSADESLERDPSQGLGPARVAPIEQEKIGSGFAEDMLDRGRPPVAGDAEDQVQPPHDLDPERGTSAPAAAGVEWGAAREDAASGAAPASLGRAADEDSAVDEPEDRVHVRPAAIVVPLGRPRAEDAADARSGGAATLQRLLRLAADRGAASLYLVAQAAPMVRIDGEFSELKGESPLSSGFVERLVAELGPRPREGAASAPMEWVVDLPDIGRVRCVGFRDHQGVGVICRMVPPQAISADQLGLPAEVQALCTEADGLVLVGGGRGSGRSTLLTCFVDLINRSRSDHVITIESQIEFVHENQRSFISQREVKGDGDVIAAAVRAAVREEPDVLVIEELRTPELVWLALEAAESGCLVFGTVPSISAVSIVERVIEMFPAERREKAQVALAGVLRGVVSQVLLRRLRGGRVAAREILLNTAAVSNLMLEGRTSQLQAVLDEGRRSGMLPFAESLAALVREGTVHPAHAYRKAPGREQFLSVLRRDGMDAGLAERLG